MSFSVTDAMVQQFMGNVRLTAQQGGSRLRPCVMEDTITGESAFLEQIAPSAARKKTSRHSDSPIMNTQHLRRRVVPYTWEWGDLIDKADKVRLLIDPASAYVTTAGKALGRACDDEIIAAFFGTAYVGHAGTTALAWPNGNSESVPPQPAGTQVAVNDWTYGNGSGNVGLTISKLISASIALDASEADEDEDRYIVCKAKQKGNLLATTEVTSADYASVRALVDGKITTFMGFKFIRSERITLDATGYDQVAAFCKSAMGLGVASDITTRVAERADKSFSWYAYGALDIGGSRLEEPKLVEIKCA